MAFMVPPGGFAGFRQMTPASQRALFPGGRSSPRSSKRRKSKRSKVSRKARTAKRGGGRKLKFGSPAWQKKYKVGRFAKKRK